MNNCFLPKPIFITLSIISRPNPCGPSGVIFADRHFRRFARPYDDYQRIHS